MPLTGGQDVGKKVKAYNGRTIVTQDMSKIYRMKFDKSKVKSVQEAIDAVKEIGDVEFAEPNYLLYTMDDGEASFNDPLYSQQWGFPALKLPQINALPKLSNKRPIIAIIDTGVDITHPDLADNIWTNSAEANGTEDQDDDGNGFKDDIHGWDFVNQTGRMRDNNGHGTHCAGIAAAVGNNNIGIVGANPDAYIMPIVVMQSDGTGDVATIIKGVDYAAANGADIISMSLGSYAYSIAEEQALGKAYAKCVIVAAAGNDGHTIERSTHCYDCLLGGVPSYPAAFSFVLGVESSTSTSGSLAGYSNWDNNGPIYSSYGEAKLYNYELRAPGSNILSTYPGGKYKALNGTSMSCPFAAGTISRMLMSKEYDSKEILFGDLIHASGVGNFDALAAYRITDADRQPSLELVTYTIDDSKSLSDKNDGDGRLDAGETIDIYPVIRNYWGQASNIKCSLSVAENEDPTIISIPNQIIDFGNELSSYAKGTSVNPLRFKVNDECVDGRHIKLVIGATCSNISEDMEQEVVLTAENGVEIGGIISENMTLTSGVHYIVTNNLGVAKGVTLTIEPGTVIKFKDNTGISNYGIINANGTKENRIIFTKADNAVGTIYRFQTNSVSNASYNFVDFIQLIDKGETMSGFFEGTFRNCSFKNCDVTLFSNNSTVEKCNVYSNSWVRQLQANIDNTLFLNSNIIGNEYIYSLNSFDQYYGLMPKNLSSSNVFGNYYKDIEYNLITYSNYPVLEKCKTPSYFGSSIEQTVRKSIVDILHPDNKYYFQVDLSNMLTKPSSEAHGIVWKVLVNGTDPQDDAENMLPLGVGKHKFEVYFNRPMNKEIAPAISMGVRPPYTQATIGEDGAWNEDGTIYTAYLTITGKSNYDGVNRIRVYGAEDNEYFEIPDEKYRFNVNVQKSGSMSTGLMATEGLGKVTLNWETTETDFEDLLGFNVYRYNDREETVKYWGYDSNNNWTELDSTRIVQDTIIVNSELIEPGTVDEGKMEQSFIDYDVVPGTTYYYLVKEVSTDLNSYEVSNPVAATPLTAQKGDANGSMGVDVADVVTEISYLTGGNPQPFIFEAADVNSDETVNILDVVGTIGIIQTPAGVKAMTVDNTATYSVEDGILYVESPVALGGVQVSIEGDKETTVFEAQSGLMGMEQASVWMNDSEYMLLAYSMTGKTIATGKQPLLKVGDAEVKKMVLSDANGKNIVAINGSATSIETLDELPFGMEANGRVQSAIYDLAGRKMNGNVNSMKTGVYVITLSVDGKNVKSYKFIKK